MKITKSKYFNKNNKIHSYFHLLKLFHRGIKVSGTIEIVICSLCEISEF